MRISNRCLWLTCIALACLPACRLVAEESAALKQRIKELEKEKTALVQKLEQVEAAAPDATSHPELRVEPVAIFLDRLSLRESVFDEKLFSEPARITYVRPGSGRETYSVDAGVALDLTPTRTGIWQLDLRLGLEYHRNSAAASLTNVWTTGVLFDFVIGNPATSSNSLLVNGDVRYKEDIQANLRSVVTSFEFLPVVAALRINTLNEIPRHQVASVDGKNQIPERRGILAWSWQPFFGLVGEWADDTTNTMADGHRLVGRYGAELQVFPFFRWVRERVELTARCTAWSTLDSSGVFAGDDFSVYYQAGLKYWFDAPAPDAGPDTPKKMRIGVGVNYENGDNPELSLRHIDQLTLSLTAKF